MIQASGRKLQQNKFYNIALGSLATVGRSQPFSRIEEEVEIKLVKRWLGSSMSDEKTGYKILTFSAQ